MKKELAGEMKAREQQCPAEEQDQTMLNEKESTREQKQCMRLVPPSLANHQALRAVPDGGEQGCVRSKAAKQGSVV